MPKSLEGVLLMKALSLLITEEEARLCVFIIIRKKWLRVCFDKNDKTVHSIVCNKNLLGLSYWNMSLEYLFFEFDTKFFREVVNVMLTDLASMYLNAILNTKKLVDFKIIILFNCK